MKKYKWILIAANLVLLLAYFNYSLTKKEDTLKNGKLVLFELAPVDPRSLMQGDYMHLDYAISQENEDLDGIAKRGFCVLNLDSNGVAKKVRLQKERSPLSEFEYLINYTKREWRGINLGADSYFFQEGDAEKYDSAKYGGLKIDREGNSILIGLFDEKFQEIKP